MYSDASNVGYGGYIVEHVIANGSWTAEEAKQSSTWRELVAVSRVLKSMVLKLSGKRVHWFTDNLNIVHILKVGSRKPQLHEEVLKVFNMCVEHQIKLEPEWVPREENTIADCISRIVDYDGARSILLVEWAVWTIFCRHVCKQLQYTITQVQLSVCLP